MIACFLVVASCQDSDVRLGNEALNAGDLDRALSLFKIAAERNPNDGHVNALMAVLFAKKGDFSAARNFASNARRLGSGSEVGELLATHARTLLTTNPAQAISFYGLAVEQDASISKSSASELARAASLYISGSPPRAIELSDAAMRYDSTLASAVSSRLLAGASDALKTKGTQSALQFFSAARRIDPSVASTIAGLLSTEATAQFERDPRSAVELSKAAIAYDETKKAPLGKLASDTAIAKIRGSSDDVDQLMSFAAETFPGSTDAFSKAALAYASSVDPKDNGPKIVTLANTILRFKSNDSPKEWARVLATVLEVPGTSFASALTTSDLITRFERGHESSIAVSNAKQGRDALSGGNLDLAVQFFNLSLKYDPSSKSKLGDNVWEQFSRFLFSSPPLNRQSFSKYLAAATSFGPSQKYDATLLPYANALKAYAEGYRNRAISSLQQIARSRPKSPEGQASNSLLGSKNAGSVNANGTPFHFNTWLYGVGQGKGVEINIASVDFAPDRVRFRFKVTSVGHPDALFYGKATYNRGPMSGSCEQLYIVDDNGAKFYTTSGFSGGNQSTLNECALGILFAPDQETVLTADFPPVSPGANSIAFYSPDPDKFGHQTAWQWGAIYFRQPPFDVLDPVKEAFIATDVQRVGSTASESSKPANSSGRCFQFNGQQLCE